MRYRLTFLIISMFLARLASAQIAFSEVAHSVGIDYSGPSFGSSWGDFNGDGRPDLWVGSHGNDPRLYINTVTGAFELLPGTGAFRADNHGAAWADFDNDGDQDLLMLNGAQGGSGFGANVLLVNSAGQLVDKAAEFGLDYRLGRGRTPLWFDWNGDGQLDVFLTNDPRPDGLAPSALFTRHGGSFIFDNALAGIYLSSNNSFAQLGWSHAVDRPILMVQRPDYPQLLMRYDVIPFQRVAEQFAFPVSHSIPLVRKAQDVGFRDFDVDGQEDFFVLQARSPKGSVLSDGQLSGRLENGTGIEVGLQFSGGGGSINFSFRPFQYAWQGNIFIGATGFHPNSPDFSLDAGNIEHQGLAGHAIAGEMAIYIGFDVNVQRWTILASSKNWFGITYVANGVQAITDVTDINIETSDGAKKDILLLNKGGRLVDATAPAHLDMPTSCVSVAAADFDNDMDIDLYLVCRGVAGNKPNLLLVNNGDATFSPLANAGGAAGSLIGVGESATVADFDLDGFVDIFVTNGGGALPFGSGPDQLFRNLGNSNNWIELDFSGVESNADGIGARVEVLAGGIRQVRLVDGGMHRFSQDHARLHFGLAGYQIVDEILIDWPSGSRQVLSDVMPNQILRIIECTGPLLAEDNIETDRGQAITVDLLANDTCLDNVPISVSLGALSTPSAGTLGLDISTNRMTIRPAADFAGQVTFTYTVSDARGRESTAMVNVHVNDLPQALPDSADAESGNPINIDILSNDSGLVDGLKQVRVTIPPASGGTAGIDAGQLVYASPVDFSGTDSLEYEIIDNNGDSSTAIVTIEVHKAALAPVENNPVDNNPDMPAIDTSGGGGAVHFLVLLTMLLLIPLRRSG